MTTSAEKRCQDLQQQFEGRIGLFVEEGTTLVRVHDIRYTLAARNVSAEVEEIHDPLLSTGYYGRDRHEPRRRRISAGYLTSHSAESWAMGYGGWRIHFSTDLIDALKNDAASWPPDLDTNARYGRVCIVLMEHQSRGGDVRVFDVHPGPQP